MQAWSCHDTHGLCKDIGLTACRCSDKRTSRLSKAVQSLRFVGIWCLTGQEKGECIMLAGPWHGAQGYTTSTKVPTKSLASKKWNAGHIVSHAMWHPWTSVSLFMMWKVRRGRLGLLDPSELGLTACDASTSQCTRDSQAKRLHLLDGSGDFKDWFNRSCSKKALYMREVLRLISCMCD